MYRGEVRSPVFVLILNLVTCGIYNLYWIYKVSQETQNYSGTQTLTPAAEMLLCLFTCGIYYCYWYYKYGRMVADCQHMAGLVREVNSVLYLILAIFGLGIINTIIMQASLNKVWQA